MFGREVTMRLKANAAGEFTRIAESDIIPILRRQKGFRDETIFTLARPTPASQYPIGSNLAAIVLVGSKLVEAAQTSNTVTRLRAFPPLVVNFSQSPRF